MDVYRNNKEEKEMEVEEEQVRKNKNNRKNKKGDKRCTKKKIYDPCLNHKGLIQRGQSTEVLLPLVTCFMKDGS